MPMWDDNVTSNLTVKKKRMRAQMNGIRQMLGAEGRARIDEQIAERVCSHPAYDEADIIFSYLSSCSLTGRSLQGQAVLASFFFLQSSASQVQP